MNCPDFNCLPVLRNTWDSVTHTILETILSPRTSFVPFLGKYAKLSMYGQGVLPALSIIRLQYLQLHGLTCVKSEKRKGKL